MYDRIPAKSSLWLCLELTHAGIIPFVIEYGYSTVKGGDRSMKKAIVIFVAALMLLFSVAVPALASQPPGLLGYEGQPGNQGGPQHHP